MNNLYRLFKKSKKLTPLSEEMGNRIHAIAYLKSIEEKYVDYFSANQLSILDCVEVKGLQEIKVKIIDKDLPIPIKNEIKWLFWCS